MLLHKLEHLYHEGIFFKQCTDIFFITATSAREAKCYPQIETVKHAGKSLI